MPLKDFVAWQLGWNNILFILHITTSKPSTMQPHRPDVSCSPIKFDPGQADRGSLALAWPLLMAPACPGHSKPRRPRFFLFLMPSCANFGPGQPRPGQAGLALWPGLPRIFYPLANPARARLVARLTPAFRPGFGPGQPRSGQVPDARGANL